MDFINRNVFLNYLDCPLLSWFAKRNEVPKETSLNNDFLIFESRKIRKLAKELFLNSVSGSKKTFEESSAFTRELIENKEIKTIIDGYFFDQNFFAKTDILQRLNDGTFHLFEVKLGGKYKVKYAKDVAFAVMVLKRCGVTVSKIEIIVLDNNYMLEMDKSKLFKFIDITKECKDFAIQFECTYENSQNEILSDNKPQACLKKKCKNCAVFDDCAGKDVKNHIFDLPRLSVLAMEELIALGADTIDKIPDELETTEFTEMQKVVKNVVLTGKTFISPNLKAELEKIKPPFYYLDFESITPILPLYPGVTPHAQLLTQFSLDKTDLDGNILEHHEYIADHKKDCRREIAEKLVEYIKNEGSIVTYANFEKNAILKLCEMFPDLAEKLKKIAERIVDLEIIIRKNYYTLNFHGKTSIKRILPVMVPNLNYDDLEISEGGAAAAAFAFMAMGLYDDEKIEETKKNLLVYCARDTFAMIKIHQFLLKIISKETQGIDGKN